MTEYCLTVVDTSGIQNYVFGTNNLRQNVGASYLADCATRQWAVDAIPGSHNVMDLDKSDGAFRAQRIEGGEIDAEVAYAGGGNILLIFKHAGLAKEFTRRLTRRLASDAPGLRVTVAHREFDWETQPLGGKTGVLQALMQDLARKKKMLSPYWQFCLAWQLLCSARSPVSRQLAWIMTGARCLPRRKPSW